MLRQIILFGVLMQSSMGCRSGCGTEKNRQMSTRTIADLSDRFLAIFNPPPPDPWRADQDVDRVVVAFRQAGPFKSLPAAGKQEIWFGKAYNLEPSGSSTESWLFLRIRPGAVDDRQLDKAHVARDLVLPYAVYTNVLGTDDIAEESDAIELFYAGVRAQPVHPSNHALPYIRKAKALDGEWPLIKTGGPSLVVAAPRPRWLRQQDRRLLLIDLAADASLEPPFKVTGSYAELWRVE